jgi:hypothetical protein
VTVERVSCHDEPVPADPDPLARLTARAEAVRDADAALDAELAALRAQNPPVPWKALVEATGLSVGRVRHRVEHPTAERTVSPKRPLAKTDPTEGLSLAVAAKALGVNRQTLANRVQKAAEDSPGPIVVTVSDHRVTVLLPDDPTGKTAWRVWID